MRSPIYRNLDQPFRIGGFSPFELVLLSVSFAGGGELFQDTGLSRAWAFALTMLVGLSLFLFRRNFGELFFARLIRFINLPSELRPALFKRDGRDGKVER